MVICHALDGESIVTVTFIFMLRLVFVITPFISGSSCGIHCFTTIAWSHYLGYESGRCCRHLEVFTRSMPSNEAKDVKTSELAISDQINGQ